MKQPALLKIYCTNYARTGYGAEDITKEEFLETVIQYNDQGKIVQEEHYLLNHNLETSLVNEYNEAGLLLTSAQYDGENKLIQKTDYYYDDFQYLIKQDFFLGGDVGVYSSHYIYEDGLLVRQDSYDEDVFSYTEKEFSYNDKRLLEKIVEYDEDKQVKYIITNEYNDSGFVIKRVREEVQEKDRRTYIFEYDEIGNKVKDLIYDYDEYLISKVYYRYNEQKQLLEKEDEDLDRYLKTVNTLEGENVIKTEIFNKEETLLSYQEYAYDESGAVVLHKQYAMDEAENGQLRLFVEHRYVREY